MPHPTRRHFLHVAATASLAAALPVPRLGWPAAAQTNAAPAGEPTAWTLLEAAEALAARRVSSTELTQACLARITQLDPRLNAFITITGDGALVEARRADQEIAAGRVRGPLHGIPLALKDLFDTAGVRTTAGSAVFAERVPAEDAEVVRRLRSAGAVLLGKLNMHEFAYGDTSAQSHFGPVRNPWNTAHVAGGSSGGSAAAVAAGLCYGALGSDTGGSIRQPAAYCGIVGLKPTFGVVSTRGVVPLSWSLDHVGPICRRVADAAVLLQVMAGYDAGDVNSLDVPVPDYRRALDGTVAPLRLGLPRMPFYETLDPEIERLVTDALRVLRSLTAGTRDVTLPPYGTLPVVGGEAYAYHAPYFTKAPHLYQPMTRRRLEGAATVTAAAYIEGRRELERLRRAVHAVFTDVDLLVTPTTPILPPTVDAAVRDPGTPPPGGVAPSLRNTQPFDIYGLPTISVPCGVTAGGLPVGLSITGPRLGEGRVLSLAQAYERATTWHRLAPQF